MKIKFNLNGELPLNKTIEILSIIIVVRAVFHENNKCYPHVFLDECIYKLWIISEYRRNYYLTYKKHKLWDFVEVLKILGQLKKYNEFSYQVFRGLFTCYVL